MKGNENSEGGHGKKRRRERRRTENGVCKGKGDSTTRRNETTEESENYKKELGSKALPGR